MKIHCIQTDIQWEDKQANFASVEGLCEAVSFAHGDLLVLPEMFATGFSMNSVSVSEPLQGKSETLDFLQHLAKKHSIFVLGGMVVHHEGNHTNDALLISSDGTVAGRYSKMYPFSFAGEDAHISPGKSVHVFEVNGIRVAPFVCYDLRFPEIFRAAADQGAQLMCVIANWPAKREEHWLALLKARAIENQCYVAGVNRAGSDPGFSYSGRSVLFSPLGESLKDAGNSEIVISHEVDSSVVDAWRTEFPALNDRKNNTNNSFCGVNGF